jgi:hypothetical protein
MTTNQGVYHRNRADNGGFVEGVGFVFDGGVAQGVRSGLTDYLPTKCCPRHLHHPLRLPGWCLQLWL